MNKYFVLKKEEQALVIYIYIYILAVWLALDPLT